MSVRRVGGDAGVHGQLDGERDYQEADADRAEHDRAVGHGHLLRDGHSYHGGRRSGGLCLDALDRAFADVVTACCYSSERSS